MNKARTAAFLIPLLAAGLCRPGWAGLTLGRGSKLWLEGDSTLHRYSSQASQIDFSADLPAGPQGLEEGVRGGQVKSLKVTIPVAGMKSGESGLDKNMGKALKAKEHPEISFGMTGYSVAAGTAAVITASGDLEIAGSRRPVSVSAAWRLSEGRLILDGEQALKMSDFGVKPPTLMLGAIKVADRVVVKFHLELERAVEEKGPKGEGEK